MPGTKTQMTIRSKTYRGSGFNELRFDDATGKEQVYIHAQKNMDTEVLNNRTTDVKVDHTESIGNNQRVTVGTGQTVKVGSKKEGGHDQTITVANDRRVTVGNDQTVRVKHDRVVNISHDEGLYVKNDRKVTVEGKQEQSTTGDHISLVKGTHSLEVKGDLARKVSGALGIKVEGDIVLESSSRISLKAGGSFIVIHAGGVDIMGPKINLNGGGSAGTPVSTLQPAVLEALADEEDDNENGSEVGEDHGDEKGSGDDSGGGDSGDGDDEQDDSDDNDENEPKIRVVPNIQLTGSLGVIAYIERLDGKKLYLNDFITIGLSEIHEKWLSKDGRLFFIPPDRMSFSDKIYINEIETLFLERNVVEAANNFEYIDVLSDQMNVFKDFTSLYKSEECDSYDSAFINGYLRYSNALDNLVLKNISIEEQKYLKMQKNKGK
ncbi:TPA: hypothetical protein MOX26_004459 [Salmonella enterica subsp. enterica serovar Ball]|nr:hypothetical protein [Salmonella enterica subsp. enterica serovar Ball]